MLHETPRSKGGRCIATALRFNLPNMIVDMRIEIDGEPSRLKQYRIGFKTVEESHTMSAFVVS